MTYNELCKEFDVISIDYWQCPFESGIPLLTMPNVPRPLHALNPRNLMGKEEWDKQRMECYQRANGRCEICGITCDRPQAHELYSYNYISHTGVYKRLVALCDKCHRSVHSGRLATMTKEGYVPTSYYLKVAEHCFSLIHAYNKVNNTELRVYDSFLSALKNEEIRDDLIRLINKYNIKFYRIKCKDYWSDWKLLWGVKVIRSPYSSQEEWEQQMAVQHKNDYMRAKKISDYSILN